MQETCYLDFTGSLTEGLPTQVEVEALQLLHASNWYNRFDLLYRLESS